MTGPIPYDGYGLTFDFHGRIVFGNGGPELYAADIRSGEFETITTGFDYPEGSEVEPPKCKGKTATIVGCDKRDDKIKGQSKAMTSSTPSAARTRSTARPATTSSAAAKGKDKLKGGGGKDKLKGGGGKDKLNGGPGKDKERQ